MIYIREDKPRKITGRTTLFVSFFPFKQEIVNVLKSCDAPFDFSKKNNNCWEFPLTCLSYLLDNLTYLDDIELNIQQDKNLLETNGELKLQHKTKPFKYQEEAIKYGLVHNKWLLLDEMGLGKTLTIIELAEELKAQKGIHHCLIICGVNSLKTNWKHEIEAHSNLSCRVLGETFNSKNTVSYGSLEDRADELSKPIKEFFIITNIESFRSKKTEVLNKKGEPKLNAKGKKVYDLNSPLINIINNSPNQIEMVAIDEIHKIKSVNSLATDSIMKLDVPYKIAATGTLLLNSPTDTYIPLAWTDNDKSTFFNFEKEYCTFGGFGGHQIVGYQNLDLLKDELENCSLRRTKEDVSLDLPKKTVISEYVDLDDEHQAFYDAIKNGVKEEADKVDLNTSSLLALVTRLRQATVCPSILTTKNILSTKLARCTELTANILEENKENKIVIMSTFKESVEKLKDMLKDYKPVVCTGDTNETDTWTNINKFTKEEDCKILIGTWQKIGTGLTLTAANYMIFLDTPWTYSIFDQACDRIHRISQTKPVFIYNLIASNTIDERVKYLLNLKKSLSDFVVDDKLTDQSLAYLRQYIKSL